MSLKEIGYKIASTRIFTVIFFLLFIFMCIIFYPLAYLADKKLEAEEEQQKNKIDTE